VALVPASVGQGGWEEGRLAIVNLSGGGPVPFDVLETGRPISLIVETTVAERFGNYADDLHGFQAQRRGVLWFVAVWSEKLRNKGSYNYKSC